MNKTILTFLLVIFGSAIQGQENVKELYLTRVIEDIIEELDDDAQVNNITEELYYYSEHPINIKSDDLAILLGLNLISQLQFENLNIYLKRNKILSIYELQYINGFNKNTLERLIPFITIKDGMIR